MRDKEDESLAPLRQEGVHLKTTNAAVTSLVHKQTGLLKHECIFYFINAKVFMIPLLHIRKKQQLKLYF